MARVWQGYGKGMARLWQGYGKGPRSLRALPEHPAEVAVPRVWPWRGRGRWPVRLAFCGGEGRPGSGFLPAPSHFCKCCGVAASSPVVRARARVSLRGGRAQGREHKTETGTAPGSSMPWKPTTQRAAVSRVHMGGTLWGEVHKK